jgi:hypothetical protein
MRRLTPAAGDAGRFRESVRNNAEGDRDSVDDLERDRLGYPIDMRERLRHNSARQQYIQMLIDEQRPDAGPLIRRLDDEDPAFYVRWSEGRSAAAGE